MLESFKSYMKDEHGVDVELSWIKADRFSHILDIVKDNKDPNAIGVSALSITDKRMQYAEFSTSYFPDITVLVSSPGSQIVKSFDEMDQILNNMSAVTIKGTKYETTLRQLKKQFNASFEIDYIESDINILETISNSENKFGFIDLPIYLMLIRNGGEVTRQNFFTSQGRGYAFILPRSSPWKSSLDEFLVSEKFQPELSQTISKYLGQDLYSFIDDVYIGGELDQSLLTKEKEMQLEMIKNANLRLEQERSTRIILIVSTAVAIIFLLVIGYLFYKYQKSTSQVIGQKDQIEEQQEDIRQKNEQLINRNAQLVALNEEKNNLVRILAHDIRSPLGQIIMVIDIINQNVNHDFSETEAKMLNQVTASAERINKMVTKILDIDGLEGNRVKVLNERVDVRDVMRDIIQRYRPVAANKNISLELTYGENHNIIRTDHLLLLLVLENLISNAVKFSEQNTTVSLTAECAYDSVLFKISDEGPGLSEEDKKKLFNRFQKLSAKPTGGEVSTGLGLSIVKKYVQDLGGKVWVESKIDKGSTFFVKLTA